MPIHDQDSKFETPRLLLVEGKDDFHVTSALCEIYRLPENFAICDCGSYDDVWNVLILLLAKAEPPKVVGIMIDADVDLAGRWQSIQDKMNVYPYLFPDAPNSSGTIIEAVDDKPRLGIWLMPNNVDAGMLEDFCRQLAPAAAIEFADRCAAEAKVRAFGTFREVHHSKAVIHTYLAWQDEPGRPLGQAITAQALRPNTEIAQSFTRWLGQLFG